MSFPPATKHQAFRDLAGCVCACGSPKRRHMSHCSRCYFRLPKPMRSALYDTHDDYIAPYNASLEYLGHESPAAREDRLRAEAIKAGNQAVIIETQEGKR